MVEVVLRYRDYGGGGRGGPCLGHGDAGLVTEQWNKRINTLFSLFPADNNTFVPHELLDWCKQWSQPRQVEALGGVVIKHAVAGDVFTAFATYAGQLFVCGSGPAVPLFIPAGRIMEEEEDESEEEENDLGQVQQIDKMSSYFY